MENTIQWMFSGIGTETIIFIISVALGGGIFYCIKFKNTIYQRQYGKNKSYQNQKNIIRTDCCVANSLQNKTIVKQIQKAGNDSFQRQIGEINVRK